MKTLNFYKYQGAGNDFVLFDREIQPEDLNKDQMVKICDRNFGVGSDGIIFICPSENAEYTMRMFNPDGSEAEMCGNGIRCMAKHLADFGLSNLDLIPIESKAGIHECEVHKDDNGKVVEVEVGMGRPSLLRSHVGMEGQGSFVNSEIEAGEHKFNGTAVSMGNPHFVIFEGKNIEEASVIGPAIENSKLFKNRTNVEFVEQTDKQRLKAVVWERGAGITLACGTGACAVASAAMVEQRVDKSEPIFVDLPGGELVFRVNPENGGLLMRGPAAYVFSGTIEV